jgi:hypothetical protein
LIDKFTLRVDFKLVGFGASNNLVSLVVGGKLNLNQTIFLVYRVDDVALIDLTEGFAKECETDSIQKCAFASTIRSDKQSVLGVV